MNEKIKSFVTLFTHLWLVLFVLFLGQSIYFRFLNFRTEVCMSWRTVILFFSYFFPEKIVKWSPHVLLIECSMFTPNQSINILLLNIALCTKFIFLNRYTYTMQFWIPGGLIFKKKILCGGGGYLGNQFLHYFYFLITLG